jgi:transposase-like protein
MASVTTGPAAETIPGEPAAAGAQAAAAVLDEELARRLVAQAKADGVSLTGPGGMLGKLTKMVLETALEAEMTAHLGYEAHDPAGRHGGNSRNGSRTKTVVTEVGPVQVEVPRDRDGSFAPAIVAKRQRRLDGVEDLVVSLVAKGLTTGEVQAHLAEIYGTDVSRQTISDITDKVIEGMEAWRARPLDAVYAVVFIDAIVRHEAPCLPSRGEGPHRLAVAAAGLKLEAA